MAQHYRCRGCSWNRTSRRLAVPWDLFSWKAMSQGKLRRILIPSSGQKANCPRDRMGIASGGIISGRVRLPTCRAGGPFTIRVTARAERTDEQPVPELRIEYGYFVSGLTTTFRNVLGSLPIPDTQSQVYELKGRSEFFPQPDTTVPPDKLNGVVVLYNALRDGMNPPKPRKEEVPEAKGDKKKKRKKKKKRSLYMMKIRIFPRSSSRKWSLWEMTTNRGRRPFTRKSFPRAASWNP